jgi:hypothetical protein
VSVVSAMVALRDLHHAGVIVVGRLAQW